jgi:hypothetical protein
VTPNLPPPVDPDVIEKGDEKILSPSSDVPIGTAAAAKEVPPAGATGAGASISEILQSSKSKGLVKASIVEENQKEE